MKTNALRHTAFAASCIAAMASLPAPAAAQSRTETLAITGQSAAGAGVGATFGIGFSSPVLNDAGQTAFTATLARSAIAFGLYLNAPGQKPAPIALQGQSAPGAGGGTFTSFVAPVLNQAGQTAFRVNITGGSSAIYRSGSGGVLTAIGLEGQTATGAGAGTFSGFGNPMLNDAGQTAFEGFISGASSTSGIYRSSSGSTLTAIALRGQSAPGAGAGTFSVFNDLVLNQAGQMAFRASITGGSSTRGIYRSNGASTLTAIALTGQSAAGAGAGTFFGFGELALNDVGQAAFQASITGGSSNQGIYRSSSGGTLAAIVLAGQSATGAGGGTFSSFDRPVLNQAGQTAFQASITGGSSNQGIYRSSSDSALTAIAVQGQSAPGAGAGTFSSLFSPMLNEGGQAAFRAVITGGSSNDGLFASDGIDTVAVQLQGAALAGKTVSFTTMSSGALNLHGQVAYLADFTDGTQGTFLFTPALRWRSSASGSWANAANWTLGLNPADVHDVTLDPSRSLTVTGPADTVKLRSLQVGTGAGIATLAMAGGRIDAESMQVGRQGVLSGTGSFGKLVSNQGVLQAGRLQLSGGLVNAGTVRGAVGLGSRLETDLSNTASGRVRVGLGESLQLIGATHRNAGVVEVNGGRLETSGSFSTSKAGLVDLKDATVVAEGAWRNDPGARLLLNESRLTSSGGFSNAGQVLVTAGRSELFGAVVNEAGGQILLSGQSTTTFYDKVEVRKGAELRVSAGATAVFFGAVEQRNGALLSGTGHKYFEGGFSVGDSPGLGEDAGDVSFGAANLYLAEIGGTELGGSYDQYRVAGTLTLGGTLKLASFAGFSGQVGQRFDLFDWGSLQGRFSSIDSSGLLLAEGTQLDLSRLYIDGVIGVTAVPEPQQWALLLSGLGLMAWRRRLAHQP
ncbi:hypothetical protein RQP53_09005 [Paucibacter sp. APW11]|uniref:Ice-binding protein C-terminal domain-containing protein n=1 Tax=Roseateles aquae TaxID=3077235 RepID=A0ABU3PA03_9BURK|nr:choice-of-anchor tandem repeat NxxGxxAF-containing protein [Paucibacter sp. APW11]MDT8999402.1 hypothetical protein [Paucibacter sp. APW11]